MGGSNDLQEVESMIRQHNPEGAAQAHPEDVVTAEWVRMKCQFGCGGYGMCLTCPPHSPTPEQTRRLLDDYSAAYVIWWGPNHRGREELGEIERGAFLLGYYRAFMMGMGPCGLCRPCPLERPCLHPHDARPAMEACGIDVYETARRAGFPLQVVTCREDTPNYYSLLLVE